MDIVEQLNQARFFCYDNDLTSLSKIIPDSSSEVRDYIKDHLQVKWAEFENKVFSKNTWLEVTSDESLVQQAHHWRVLFNSDKKSYTSWQKWVCFFVATTLQDFIERRNYVLVDFYDVCTFPKRFTYHPNPYYFHYYDDPIISFSPFDDQLKACGFKIKNVWNKNCPANLYKYEVITHAYLVRWAQHCFISPPDHILQKVGGKRYTNLIGTKY